MAVVFDAKCYDCGDSLDVVKYELDADHDLILTVKPCERCCDETKIGQSYRFWGVRNARPFVVLGRDGDGMFCIRLAAGQITYVFPWEPVMEG